MNMNPIFMMPLIFGVATGRDIADLAPAVMLSSNQIPENARAMLAVNQVQESERQRAAVTRSIDSEILRFIVDNGLEINKLDLNRVPRIRNAIIRELKRQRPLVLSQGGHQQQYIQPQMERRCFLRRSTDRKAWELLVEKEAGETPSGTREESDKKAKRPKEEPE
jgi:hypothetical protein